MMIEKIGKAAMLEQLAEEAAELSQAALKLARVLRGEKSYSCDGGKGVETFGRGIHGCFSVRL